MTDKMIYDPFALRAIVKVSGYILHKHFFYGNEEICWYIDTINESLTYELAQFEANAEKRVLDELRQQKSARFHFTCYFVDTYIKKLFVDEMHFSEQELQAYESILPRYTGDILHEPTSPNCTRAND